MTLAVMVPSRGRPDNIEALCAAWSATMVGTTELYVLVDEEDPCCQDYTRLHLPSNVQVLVGEGRRRLGEWLNYYAPILAVDHGIVGFMGDDHRPRSIGWPTTVLVAMPAGGVVYGNDLVQGPNLPTAVFMDARIVRALGHFVLPGQIHLWMDNYWKTLGEQLGTLRYLPECVIEHVHPLTGKVAWDEGYAEANSASNWENDERIYKEWVAHQMPADIAKVREALR